LDVGCGPGDVLIDLVIPKMQGIHCKEIVGVDISSEMVACAMENYQNEFISFHQMDIASDLSECSNYFGERQFDNITSFYCLHWIQNQK